MMPGGVVGDTIYAPASGQARAAIAVIRISGPASDAVLAAVSGPRLPAPRRAARRRLRRADGTLLDEALVLRFAGAASFTGEAMAELHVHGGRAVLEAVLDAVAAVPGTRLAEPGEFTLRAFANGRMDLAEVEALGDLIAAETEAQRLQAARRLDGALHRRTEAWRAALLRALALTEATIDWADEAVPEDPGPEVVALLAGVAAEIAAELRASGGAERLRAGFEVAILGRPNAGKSTLLNRLAGRDAAITSPVPGTTRDVLEVRCDLEGLPVAFLDTAGLRPTADPIEAEGVARARARAAAADLRIWLTPAVAAGSVEGPVSPEAAEPALWRGGDLWVRTMVDLGGGGEGLAVSARTGEGIAELLATVACRLRASAGAGLVANRRQRAALEAGAAALGEALEGLESRGAELVSEDIRRGIRALERLIGRVGTEDVLGEVFAAFCLGK